MFKRDTLWLLAILLIGGFLRFYRLESQCLWLDEIASFQLAELIDRESPLIIAKRDNVAPLSHWVLWGSMKFLRPTLALRLPTAIMSLATLPLIFLLGVRMFSSRAIGLAAAAIAAISPLAVWYAQDGRMYSMLVLFSSLELLFFWEILAHQPKWWHWIGLTLATSLAIYTHQYGALLSVACGVYLLAQVGIADRRFRVWLLCESLAALSFVPWVILGLDRALSSTAGTPKSQVLLWMPYTFFAYLFGFSLGPSVRELHGHISLSSIKSYLWCLVPTSLASLWIAVVILNRSLKPDVRKAGVLCLTLIVIPIALVLLLSQVTKINYNVRYTLVSFPAFLLLLGLAAREMARSLATRIAMATIITFMLISLYNHYNVPIYSKEEIRPAGQLLSERLGPSDSLIVSSGTATAVLKFYGFTTPRAPWSWATLEARRPKRWIKH